ncbi:40S ribosomal protein S5-1 [Hordeum vulgare]|nr:40S ribosomal protein S5-1 [Hordeum vulgare]
MNSPKAPKDKLFEKVINPYLTGVLQHPQSIEMREGMLHIRDVEGPKKTGSMETRLEAMDQQVFKCQGMVERGLNANHMMITEFTNKHKIDANDIGKHLSRLYDRIDQLQAQIYDLQNQNYDVVLTNRVNGAFRLGSDCLDMGKQVILVEENTGQHPPLGEVVCAEVQCHGYMRANTCDVDGGRRYSGHGGEDHGAGGRGDARSEGRGGEGRTDARSIRHGGDGWDGS